MKSVVLSEELRIQGYINAEKASDRRERPELGSSQRHEIRSVSSERRAYGQG